ncbi:MAG: ATP-binding protein [Kiritimatiellaeota bacterium]|nr:ATP-binding protein [Kiritimatiellota bacterium]
MIRRNIGFKLTLAVSVTALLTISIFAYVNIQSHSRSLLVEVERHASQISQTVTSSTEYDMLLNEPARIHETIKRLGGQPSIERIRIMNKTGQVIYSSDAKEIGKMVDKSAESCVRCHFIDPPLKSLGMKERTRVFQRPSEHSRTLGIITPIYNQASCWTAACHAHPQAQTILGVFDVVLPLAEVDKELWRGQMEIVIFAISAVLLLSVIIGIVVRRWVDLPVKELLAATQHVASGDLSYTIDEQREDELGMLARSFNHMTNKLSEARMQIFQSDKLAALGRLAAGVAHEINNPLTGVLTYSSLMLKQTADRPELHADLEVVVRETLRCRGIVKSLLDFARQSVPKKSAADVNEIIQRALSVVERQLALNQVVLERRLDPDLPLTTIDANQIEQVLINLLVNAADAIGPHGGTIMVSSAVLSLSPVGVTQIKQACCPKRHNLIDDTVRTDGKPSVRLKARCGRDEGFVYVDPMYGKGAHRQGVAFEEGKTVQLVCPECSVSLMVEKETCPLCQSGIYAFDIPSGGIVKGCSRAGCGWQQWSEVDASGNKEFVEIRVRDTGCGIPEEALAKIYEPFYSTKGPKGTGLGLAVIWGIVDNHNGMIEVESAVGVGTTFIVRIPVKP